ncbi:MAG: phosphatidate cytidylyltransferase [Fimbriimonadales bacterium]
MLRTRVLTALVGIPLFVGILAIPGGWAFALAGSLVSVLGAMEFARAYHSVRGETASPVLLMAGACLPFLTWWMPTLALEPYLLGAMGLAFLWALAQVWRRGTLPIAQSLGLGLLGFFYIGWLMSFVVRLRMPTEPMALGTLTVEQGIGWVMWLMAMLWAGDSSAYFVGRAIGRRKLAPALSPGKTVEGALANLGFCMLVGWLGAGWVGVAPAVGLIAGTGVGLLGQLGDLFESALKRSLGVKDFGSLLPGHGGVLDRFDSLLFSAPWVYWLLQQVGKL